MLYLARGKRGGEPTAAYEEDPTGLTSKVNAQLSGSGKILSPPVGAAEDAPSKKKRKTKAEQVAAAVARLSASPGNSSNVRQNDSGGGHPRKRGQYYTTTREGCEICYGFAKGNRDACPEPCHANRAHCCQLCLGPHRNAECQRANNGKGVGKGGGKPSK